MIGIVLVIVVDANVEISGPCQNYLFWKKLLWGDSDLQFQIRTHFATLQYAFRVMVTLFWWPLAIFCFTCFPVFWLFNVIATEHVHESKTSIQQVEGDQEAFFISISLQKEIYRYHN